MKDLTQGSVTKHILHMAVPIAIGMVVQTVYYLTDLYFVGQLGKAALAGVNAAGNLSFFVIGFTQILGVGTVALISQSVGRKDRIASNLIFNQSIGMAIFLGLLTLIAGYWLSEDYLKAISSDPETIQLGKTYLYWFIPNLAMQFALVAMGSALRGTGIVKPTMIVQLISVVVNILLSPILIAGWFTGKPMGVAGAGLASSIAILIAVILMWRYFHKLERYVGVSSIHIQPDFKIWKSISTIGFPAGGEFLLMFFYTAVIYSVIQDFGPAAQAGYGLGSRVMQAIFVPALALAFALPAVVGQNFGAKLTARVKESFKMTAIMISTLMGLLTLLSYWNAELFLGAFSDDPQVLIIGVSFLQLIAFNFIPSGLIFTCSGMLQGLGNTWPAFFSMGSRIFLFVLPAIWISKQESFELEQIWYLSIVTALVQLIISLWMVKVELNKKLNN